MKRLIALAAALLMSAAPAWANDPDAPGFQYKNITSAATYVIKTAPGVIHEICINTLAASGSVTVYDNTAGSGTKIGTITTPASLLNEGPICGFHDIAFTVGLTIITAAAQDVTVTYR